MARPNYFLGGGLVTGIVDHLVRKFWGEYMPFPYSSGCAMIKQTTRSGASKPSVPKQSLVTRKGGLHNISD